MQPAHSCKSAAEVISIRPYLEKKTPFLVTISRTMAVVRNLILAAAALLVLSMSVEAQTPPSQQSCNSQAILAQMSSCLADKNNPGAVTKDSNCCKSVGSVYNSMHPSATCMCTTANMVSGAGVTNAQIATMIGTCLSPSQVPPCLST